MKDYFYKIFSFNMEEFKLLFYATFFIFILFASYAMLRPIRDALGIHNSQEALKWLFLGTFILMIFSSFLAMYLSGAVKRRHYIDIIYYFFTINLILFFIALSLLDENSKGFTYFAYIFYIWVSVFNLFIISSAWSLLADLFSKDRSKRLFGIISAGASLGSIIGSLSVSLLSTFLSLHNFIFVCIFLLLLAIITKNLLIKESFSLLEDNQKEIFNLRFEKSIGSKNPFEAIFLIIKSKYLLAFVAFILLLTSVSTFLYMEQARIIKELFPTREARIAAFANIDLIVQSASFIMQCFFTAKIASLGLKWLLSLLGFIISLGFICLVFTHPAFLPFVIVMSIRRIGEYALVKPGREMLFVPLNASEKYKVKNFLDTVVYRGGDALSAQIEGFLAKISLTCVLLTGALISFVWGLLGVFLAKGYDKKA
ncbi:MFS transporter [Campylobacter sp. LR264d]|uniref:NTP/NDP exchange transporter n=1 Tax=Campylobacter sp. LR264d TaxID=2593544 RepID=UPI0012395F1E|nr:MFS transporter [Campylobacter sp. LR264d]KAA6234546.1 MFS transporter [Campylobacter sp. LR264d]